MSFPDEWEWNTGPHETLRSVCKPSWDWREKACSRMHRYPGSDNSLLFFVFSYHDKLLMEKRHIQKHHGVFDIKGEAQGIFVTHQTQVVFFINSLVKAQVAKLPKILTLQNSRPFTNWFCKHFRNSLQIAQNIPWHFPMVFQRFSDNFETSERCRRLQHDILTV